MGRKIGSRNDLPEATREKVSRILNDQVAGAIHLQLLAKQAHWNVRGPNFRSLHKLFDGVFAAATVWADSLAERTAQLGWTVDSTLELIGTRTTLPPIAVDLADGQELVEGIAKALSTFGASARKCIEQTEEHGDMATSDLFTEICRGVDESLWMVEAHLQ